MAIQNGSLSHCSTPVQRRHCLNIPMSRDLEPGKHWTAARCNRLLRALTSRVAILQKELGRFSSTVEVQNADQNMDMSSECLREQCQTTQVVEDVWRKSTKRIRRTYSSKTGRVHSTRATVEEKAPLHPGEISVATPILARVLKKHVHDQVSAITEQLPERHIYPPKRQRSLEQQRGSNDLRFQLPGSLRDIRRRVPATRYNIYEGIYTGLDKLLRETESNQQVVEPKRSNTLLSLCLRAVPQYIAAEEDSLAAHLEQTGSKSTLNLRDVGTEVYDDLEMLGVSGRGWRQLKIVARSHGVHVVTDAIRSGLLHIDLCGALITLCLQRSARNEAEAILSALLSGLHLPNPKDVHSCFADHSGAQPLAMLWRYVEHTGKYSYQFKALTILISKNMLPAGWLATKQFNSVWLEAIIQVSLSSDYLDAVEFLEAALPCLIIMGAKSGDTAHEISSLLTAALNTIASLLANLISIVLLANQSPKDKDHDGAAKSFSNYKHIVSLLRRCLIHYEASRCCTNGSPLVILANLVLDCGSSFSDSNPDLIPRFINQLSGECSKILEASAGYHAVIIFIYMTARCCGKGNFSQGFENLKELHSTMERLAAKPSDIDVFPRIIVDSAIAFAQQCPDWMHVEYATLIDSTLSVGGHTTPRLPSKCFIEGLGDGQRWEEGIGEWVTVTPATEATRHGRRVLATRIRIDKEQSEVGLAGYRYQDLVESSSDTDDSVLSLHSCETKTSQQLSHEWPQRQSSVYNDASTKGEGGDSSASELALLSSGTESFVQQEQAEPSCPQSYSSDDAFLSSDPSTEESDFSRPCSFVSQAPRLASKILKRKLSGSSPITSPGSEPCFNHFSQRMFVTRVPRFGSRDFLSKSASEGFDESEDELSLITLQSTFNDELEDSFELSQPGVTDDYIRPVKMVRRISQSVVTEASWSDSEDELCA